MEQARQNAPCPVARGGQPVYQQQRRLYDGRADERQMRSNHRRALRLLQL